LPYLAPEQVRGEPVGPPADVYALGLVLLESLSGRRVFPDDDWASAELRRPPVIPADLPEPLRGTLRAMTDPDPRRRPDAREVAERLSRVPVEPPVRERGGGGRRTALIALAVVALLLVVVFALTRGGEPTDAVAAPDTATSAPEATEETTEETTEPTIEPTEEVAPEPPDATDDGEGITIPDLPDLPSDLPDIPTEIPQIPDDVQQDARNAWEQFTDWLGQFF
jgi:eukaryotic-like serine/threonine-protein kinase